MNRIKTMNKTNKTIALALSGAFALSVAATTVNAAENPFAIKALSSGYLVADAGSKVKEGKCGEGKCSAEMKKQMKAEADMKAKEGSCSGDMKAKEGSCHGDMKAKEGSCHGDMKAKEGSCSGDKK